jgi:hypothetical protein
LRFSGNRRIRHDSQSLSSLAESGGFGGDNRKTRQRRRSAFARVARCLSRRLSGPTRRTARRRPGND